jgi:hypothetical protein
MREREDLIHYETADSDSLTEYQRRKRAEAELATVEKTRELEAERSMRRWATARAVTQIIADHPVATVGVGLAGLWLASRIFGNRRGR